MASESAILEAIKETQDKLGKFVKKPPLTEKLLKKPPFRFLHDIITCVNRNTGFFDGLFAPEELLSENVNDRESKIYFLAKVIDVVNDVTDSSLTVNPSKVIAGHEPERTNELLQKIGFALLNNLDSKAAVKKVNDKFSKKKSPPKPIKQVSQEVKLRQEQIELKVDKEKSSITARKRDEKLKDGSSKRSTSINRKADKSPVKPQSRQKESRTQLKEVKADKTKSGVRLEAKDSKMKLKRSSARPQTDKVDSVRVEEIVVHSQQSTTPAENQLFKQDSLSKINSLPSFNNDEEESYKLDVTQQEVVIENSQKDDSNEESDPKDKDTIHMNSRNDSVTLGRNIIEDEKAPTRRDSQESASTENVKAQDERKFSNQKQNNSNNDGVRNNHTSFDKKHEKNSDKVKKQKSIDVIKDSKLDIENKEVPSKSGLQPPPIRISSARPGAPQLRERNSDVILQPSEPVLLGKVNVIVENYNTDEPEDGSLVMVDSLDSNSNSVANQKSDYQTSGNHGHLVQQILETQMELGDPAKLEIGWEYNNRKEREAIQAEVEVMKVGLQALSRSANPLGKLLDHVQEDVEVMRQEWMQWMDDYKNLSLELELQRGLMDVAIKPLENKLDHLNTEIKEKREHISGKKSNIHKNIDKINELLSNE